MPCSSARWLVALMTSTVTLVVMAALPIAAAGDEFEQKLARVDQALRKNPHRVLGQALDTCHTRRTFAVRLYYTGQTARAMRILDYCTQLLEIRDVTSLSAEDREKALAAEIARTQARSALELEQALALEPDIAQGLEIYRECAACHMAEGWGLSSGVVPQLAGQHRKVIIKQLADIRAGNRQNPLMVPYASVEAIGGPQAVADVAGYIDTLEISVENGKGDGTQLELGKRLYNENCARCHGVAGEGDEQNLRPRIQAQHFNYLVSQFERIRDGKRQNADPEMVAQIQSFDDQQLRAVLDYVSRLQPPEELQAPKGWHNPDFGADAKSP